MIIFQVLLIPLVLLLMLGIVFVAGSMANDSLGYSTQIRLYEKEAEEIDQSHDTKSPLTNPSLPTG